MRPYGLQLARLLCPWDSPGKSTGGGCRALLQGIFSTQGSNPSLLCLLHWQAVSLPLGASLIAQLVKNPGFLVGWLVKRPGLDPWVGKMTWRRERLPTPVFWPGEFHGLYRPWGSKELDTTERISLSLSRC